MKRMLLLLAFIAPVVVCAEPASQIAWTPEALTLLKTATLTKARNWRNPARVVMAIRPGHEGSAGG